MIQVGNWGEMVCLEGTQGEEQERLNAYAAPWSDPTLGLLQELGVSLDLKHVRRGP